MPAGKRPQLNEHSLNDDYAITLPVFSWIEMSSYLTTISGIDEVPAMPQSFSLFIAEINDMLFPKYFQQAEIAAQAKHRAEHMESHPLVQMLKGFGNDGGSIIIPSEPDE